MGSCLCGADAVAATLCEQYLGCDRLASCSLCGIKGLLGLVEDHVMQVHTLRAIGSFVGCASYNDAEVADAIAARVMLEVCEQADCDEAFPSYQELLDHVTTAHVVDRIKEIRNRNEKVTDRYRMITCPVAAHGSQHMVGDFCRQCIQRSGSHRSDWECELCQRKFSRPNPAAHFLKCSLKRLTQPGAAPVQVRTGCKCALCNNEFVHRQAAADHIRCKHTPIKRIKCPIPDCQHYLDDNSQATLNNHLEAKHPCELLCSAACGHRSADRNAYVRKHISLCVVHNMIAQAKNLRGAKPTFLVCPKALELNTMGAPSLVRFCLAMGDQLSDLEWWTGGEPVGALRERAVALWNASEAARAAALAEWQESNNLDIPPEV